MDSLDSQVTSRPKPLRGGCSSTGQLLRHSISLMILCVVILQDECCVIQECKFEIPATQGRVPCQG